MGVSGSATLFYGYCWSGDVGLAKGWREAAAAKQGHRNPWLDFADPSRALPQRDRDGLANEYMLAHMEKFKAWDKALEDVSTGIAWDGYDFDRGLSFSALWIDGTEVRAYGSYDRASVPVNPAMFDTHRLDEWAARLDDFLALAGIMRPGLRPSWWLISRLHH
jgi:hypothetical protein